LTVRRLLSLFFSEWSSNFPPVKAMQAGLAALLSPAVRGRSEEVVLITPGKDIRAEAACAEAEGTIGLSRRRYRMTGTRMTFQFRMSIT